MKLNKGITLIEMLVYVTLLSFISFFMVLSIFRILDSYNGYRVNRYINVSGVTAMERIVREIRLADDILGATVFDTNPGVLSLNTIDPGTEAATTIEFSVSSDQLMVNEGAGTPVALTSTGLEVTNLVFREVAPATNPHSKAIKIELELRGQRGNHDKSIKFYNTVLLRRSY